MSACFSLGGEYSEHVLGEGAERFVCQRCGEFDEDGCLARLEAAESARDEALAAVERVRAAVYWGRSDGWVWKRDLRAALTPSAPTEEER